VVDVDWAKLDAAPSRFNVSMPRFVLAKIDRYAQARHETRSGFLARAALEAISRENQIRAA
jgi:metal-responsive CopG/Arc/MetJ family transcriptional regulator